MTSSTFAVEFKNVSKSFGSVKANDSISFQVRKGSIHGIIGENGAGKSTAMKILFGLYEADSGEIFVNGQAVQLKNPTDAMNAGIGMVHQHFMLAEPVTALDNILLQKEGSAFERLDRAGEKKKLETLAERYGFDIDLEARIEDLSVGAQQRIEILKILSQNSEIIILDEPTAVLTPQEVLDLFENLRRLKAEGKTILLITHKLKEVMGLTDSVTVFRAGSVIANKTTKETSVMDLAEMMVGRRINIPVERSTSVQTEREILRLVNISASLGNHSISQLTFSVHGKEIVGIAGVEGNGQDVLIRTVLDPKSLNKKTLAGHISLFGNDIHKKSTQEIRSLGVGAFPEDRLRFGALPSRPVFENFLLGQQRSAQFCRGLFLKSRAILKATQDAMKTYDVRPQNELLPFGKLSGGNQQKLVVARELGNKPGFVLAAQPTRGVDIGAIEFIHNEIRKSRDEGAGVLLVSSELEELMALSDRILVIFKGHIVGEFKRHQFDEIAIGAAMGCGR
ncbi:Ribose import ATP-binding protein RbsA [compost metagenome]